MDEQMDLSASGAADKATETDLAVAQFQRDLTHILLPVPDEDHPSTGPRLQLGEDFLQFKPTAPISALAALIREGNQLQAMKDYVILTLEDTSVPTFLKYENRITIEGLGEIISTLGEGYTGFPDQS